MRILWLTLLVIACSGGRQQVDIAAPPAKNSQGTFAGPLCSGTTCKCREGGGDGGAGVPTNLDKRYEVRLNSPQQLWARVGDNQMYKDAERVEACFYVDLPAGK